MKTKIYLCALAALFMIPQAMTAQTKKKAKKEVAIQLYSVRDILNKVDNKNRQRLFKKEVCRTIRATSKNKAATLLQEEIIYHTQKSRS